jgi:hypothetical protein
MATFPLLDDPSGDATGPSGKKAGFAEVIGIEYFPPSPIKSQIR